MKTFPCYDIRFADGTHLSLTSSDKDSMELVKIFSHASQLIPGEGNGKQILAAIDDKHIPRQDQENLDGKPGPQGMILVKRLFRLSQITANRTRRGILLHGALAEHHGSGVLLFAKGGTGKTTASRRLPPPWRSLSDDLSLVVQDDEGHYWAHPWPTWSRFLEKDFAGSWDVQTAVPLRAIFHLRQTQTDQVETLGAGKAAILLMHSAEQALFPAQGWYPGEAMRTLRLRWIDQISLIVRSIPIHELCLSMNGMFWQRMAEVLECADEKSDDGK